MENKLTKQQILSLVKLNNYIDEYNTSNKERIDVIKVWDGFKSYDGVDGIEIEFDINSDGYNRCFEFGVYVNGLKIKDFEIFEPIPEYT